MLLNRPLPWVVRVFFQYENSIKGILCSGEAFIDPIDSLSDRPEFSDIMMTFEDNLIFLFHCHLLLDFKRNYWTVELTDFFLTVLFLENNKFSNRNFCNFELVFHWFSNINYELKSESKIDTEFTLDAKIV